MTHSVIHHRLLCDWLNGSRRFIGRLPEDIRAEFIDDLVGPEVSLLPSKLISDGVMPRVDHRWYSPRRHGDSTE